MATRTYRSTDASAPVMEYSAGSLIDVLKACLVDGYGAMPPAGWSYTTIDAPTNRAAFTQGAGGAGTTNKILYLLDRETTAGRAEAWGCSGITVSATPVLTEKISNYNTLVVGDAILKTSQSAGPKAQWFVVANERTMLLATKRNEWGDMGWSLFIIGDYASPFLSDFGNFGMSGRTMSDATIAPGDPCPYTSMASGMFFGNVSGLCAPLNLTRYNRVGASGSPGQSQYGGVYGSLETMLTQQLFGTNLHIRAFQPFIWLPIAPATTMPLQAMPDGYEFDAGGGRILKYLRIEPSASERIFIEVGGF